MEVQTVEAPNSLETMNEQQRESWLLKGTPQPKDEAESATAEVTSEPAKAESTAPATETGTKTQEPSRAERRKGELSAEIQELLRKRAELRAEVAVAEPKPKTAEKTGSAPAAAAAVDTADGKPVPPDPTKWTGTWEELEAAKIKYFEDLTEWKLKQPERDRAAAAKVEDEAARAAAFDTWKERADAAQELDPEFADARDIVGRFLTAKGVAPLVVESEVGPEIVMYLYKLPKEEQVRVSKLSPTALARELVRIEDRLAKPDGAVAAAAATGATPQPKHTSAAKKPATELSGRNATNTVDEAEAALAEGDYERYARVMNARAIKKS